MEELKQYKETHGDCHVPQHYVHNRPLGKWVNRLRTNYKHYLLGQKSALTEERM